MSHAVYADRSTSLQGQSEEKVHRGKVERKDKSQYRRTANRFQPVSACMLQGIWVGQLGDQSGFHSDVHSDVLEWDWVFTYCEPRVNFWFRIVEAGVTLTEHHYQGSQQCPMWSSLEKYSAHGADG